MTAALEFLRTFAAKHAASIRRLEGCVISHGRQLVGGPKEKHRHGMPGLVRIARYEVKSIVIIRFADDIKD